MFLGESLNVHTFNKKYVSLVRSRREKRYEMDQCDTTQLQRGSSTLLTTRRSGESRRRHKKRSSSSRRRLRRLLYVVQSSDICARTAFGRFVRNQTTLKVVIIIIGCVYVFVLSSLLTRRRLWSSSLVGWKVPKTPFESNNTRCFERERLSSSTRSES